MTAWNGWELLAEAGRGGMGVVYQARHPETKSVAALKTVQRSRSQSQYRNAIQREIAALEKLDHPGVVRILDSGFEQGEPWYAMEWVEGTAPFLTAPILTAPILTAPTPADVGSDDDETVMGSVSRIALPTSSVIKTRQPLTEDEMTDLAPMLFQALEILSAIHLVGIVHGDIKPEHFILTGNRLKLVDFGLASTAPGVHGRATIELRSPGAGTLKYIAPEQRAGMPIDARADIYAFGVILRELFTGDATGKTQLPGSTPPEVREIIGKMLESNPARRLSYAADSANAIASGFDLAPSESSRAYLHASKLEGRDAEIVQIEKHLTAGTNVCVTGAIGMGKSRVLDEVARRWVFSGRPALVLTVAGDDDEQRVSFSNAAATILPVDVAAESSDAKQLVATIIAHVEPGTLCVIDDADKLSEELERTIKAIRNETSAVTFAFGSRMPVEALGAEHIQLEPLDDVAILEIARQVYGATEPLTPESARELTRNCKGNPWVMMNAIGSSVSFQTELSPEAIIREKLDSLTSEERQAAFVIAVADGAEWDLLKALNIEKATIDTLARSGLIGFTRNRVVLVHTLATQLLTGENRAGERRSVYREMQKLSNSAYNRVRSESVLVGTEPPAFLIKRLSAIDTFGDMENELRRCELIVALVGDDDSTAAQRKRLELAQAAAELEQRTRAWDIITNLRENLINPSSEAAADLRRDVLLLAARLCSRWVELEDLSVVLQALSSETALHIRAQCSLYEGVNLFYRNDADAALLAFENAVKLWKETDDLEGLSRGLLCLGLCRGRMGELASSRTFFGKAAEIQRAQEDWKELQRSLNSMAVIDVFTGDHRSAVENLEEALIIRAGFSDSDLALVECNLASSLWHIGERVRPRALLESALDRLVFMRADVHQLLALSGLAKTDLFSNRLTDAEEWLRRADHVIERIPNDHDWNVAFVELGWARLAAERGDVAEVDLQSQKAMDRIHEVGHPGQSASAQIHRSLLLRSVGELDKAAESIQGASQFFTEAKNQRIEALYYAESALLAWARGDIQNAIATKQTAFSLAENLETLLLDIAEPDYLVAMESIG